MLPAPVYNLPPFALEGLGLLGTAAQDNWQYQGANSMGAYLDVPDEVVRYIAVPCSTNIDSHHSYLDEAAAYEER
jgi:hypothetical protein